MPVERRRFPPWTIEDSNDARFIVRDKNQLALAYAITNLSRGAELQPICSRKTRRDV